MRLTTGYIHLDITVTFHYFYAVYMMFIITFNLKEFVILKKQNQKIVQISLI